MIIGLVIAAAFVLLLIIVMGMYNSLVRRRIDTDNAWSQIDVQLKRRHDLIPNLVETVKGYAGHEKTTLEQVVQARAAAVQARGISEAVGAENALSGALSRLMLVVEQYPDLKANQNFLALQEELTSTENRIGFARQAFNDAATNYNIGREVFPAVKVAALLETAETERAAPRVSFQ